jgi:hypothetical protein
MREMSVLCALFNAYLAHLPVTLVGCFWEPIADHRACLLRSAALRLGAMGGWWSRWYRLNSYVLIVPFPGRRNIVMKCLAGNNKQQGSITLVDSTGIS